MAHSQGEAVKSLVSKRSIVIAGHKTSVSLEDQFWNSLRQHANLSSAIRLFVLSVYRDQVASRQDRTREALTNAVAR